MDAYKLQRLDRLKSRLAAKPSHLVIRSRLVVHGHTWENSEKRFTCAGFTQNIHHRLPNGDFVTLNIDIVKMTEKRIW